MRVLPVVTQLFLSLVVPCIVFAQGAGGPVSLSSNSGSTQALIGGSGKPAPDLRGWTDPALNHNRLLTNKQGDGAYTVVGQYKVTGSSFLFGQNHKGNIHTPTEKALNIGLSYNTYNQEVEFVTSANPGQPLVKEAGEIDSFMIASDINSGILTDIKFIYGSFIGSKEKAYFQTVATGDRFNLYKRYKTVLTIDGSNYGQTDLRRFDLTVEYFYHDTKTKKLQKLKPNAGSIIKEFKSIKDLSSEIDVERFNFNPEAAMQNAFSYLNKE